MEAQASLKSTHSNSNDSYKNEGFEESLNKNNNYLPETQVDSPGLTVEAKEQAGISLSQQRVSMDFQSSNDPGSTSSNDNPYLKEVKIKEEP